VFLDNALKGVTKADEGGEIIEDVPAGTHTLRVVKEGFNAQEASVRVEAGKVFEYRVRPFTPALEITQQGESAQQQVVQKVGHLLIQTLPVACKISIAQLGVTDVAKDKDEWLANKVPTGSYSATFRALNKTFAHAFAIEEGRTTHLFINIIAGTVRDVGAEGRTAQRPSAGAGATGKTMTVAGLGLELVQVAPGNFDMSGTRVTITRPFWPGKTEVTQAQWTAVMGNNPNNFKGESLPVEQVSWTDAVAFCKKLTEREQAAGRLPEGYAYVLPTEAQWEYACRAETTGDYAGELNAMAWYDQNAGSTTHVVATKQANAWGLHDMHGNVREWCADWYGELPGGAVRDPSGAASGTIRVRRGGSWSLTADGCRSAVRGGNSPGDRNNVLGFRLALSSVR